MRYERKKELSALLSIVSVVVTLGVALTSKVLVERESFVIMSGIAALLAASGAYISVMWSRRLAREREKGRIFLIYAREDIEAARRLTHELKERGFHPWLDVNEITPGQVWRKAVLRALEESAAALVLVSPNLEKNGFVQEELKVALETLQESEKDVSPVLRMDRMPNST
jgi:hypothetical protein